MIEERARVVELRGDCVFVEAARKSACASCSVSAGCGNALMDRLFPTRSQRMRVLPSISVKAGDEVIIGIHEDALLRGSFLVYFLPLLFMLATALVVSLVLPGIGDGWVVLSGLTGLLAGFAFVYLKTRKMVFDSRYQPVILKKVAAIA